METTEIIDSYLNRNIQFSNWYDSYVATLNNKNLQLLCIHNEYL